MSHQDLPLEDALRLHRDHLHVLGLRLSGNEAEAEDLVQETLLRAFLYRSSFTPGTNARAWLGRILRNLFIDRRRKDSANRRLEEKLACEPLHAPEHDHGRELDRARARRQVQIALDRLPNGFREAVEMVDIEGEDYATAAGRMGCPEGTVMSRVFRGRRRLAQMLAPMAQREALVA